MQDNVREQKNKPDKYLRENDRQNMVGNDEPAAFSHVLRQLDIIRIFNVVNLISDHTRQGRPMRNGRCNNDALGAFPGNE